MSRKQRVRALWDKALQRAVLPYRWGLVGPAGLRAALGLFTAFSWRSHGMI